MTSKKSDRRKRVEFIHYVKSLFKSTVKQVAYIEGVNINTLQKRLQLLGVKVNRINTRKSEGNYIKTRGNKS